MVKHHNKTLVGDTSEKSHWKRGEHYPQVLRELAVSLTSGTMLRLHFSDKKPSLDAMALNSLLLLLDFPDHVHGAIAHAQQHDRWPEEGGIVLSVCVKIPREYPARQAQQKFVVTMLASYVTEIVIEE
jgi:hypothetical protein